MDYIRKVDFTDVNANALDKRIQIRLLDHDSGAKNCTVSYVSTPPGGGSPEGLHIHDIDQIFYILSGVMNIEIEGEIHECTAGSLVVFPAGVPHRNWNSSKEPTVHLAFNTPLPDPGLPFAKAL